MKRQQLFDKKAATEQAFNDLVAKKNEIETELARLQGEFRLIESLLAEPEESEAVEGEVLDANTITVEEPKE
jgi:hypothetical protein